MAGTVVALLLFFNLLAAAPALGWLDKGHRVVALIADANLSPEARQQIQEILPAGTSLADAAVWPDHEGRNFRDFDALHYVSIADSGAGYDQSRDCPKRNCIVEALNSFVAILGDKNTPLVVRRLALRYVAHLAGDLHQPLHTGRATDSGGTLIKVSYQGQSTNLHLFWDGNLVDLEAGSDEELAKRLGANVSAEQRQKWQSGDAKQWTDESLMLARSQAYAIGESGELSDDYVDQGRSTVRTRLAQAGFRLAWLLNNAFK